MTNLTPYLRKCLRRMADAGKPLTLAGVRGEGGLNRMPTITAAGWATSVVRKEDGKTGYILTAAGRRALANN